MKITFPFNEGMSFSGLKCINPENSGMIAAQLKTCLFKNLIGLCESEYHATRGQGKWEACVLSRYMAIFSSTDNENANLIIASYGQNGTRPAVSCPYTLQIGLKEHPACIRKEL
jgi:hypothetical protein